MDNNDFRKPIKDDIRARRAARDILGVEEGASDQSLKIAWRSACKKHHPDQNQDPRSQAMFVLANCAYRYLSGDYSCQESLLQYTEKVADNSEDDDTPGNDWSHFLWWRDRFFDKPN